VSDSAGLEPPASRQRQQPMGKKRAKKAKPGTGSAGTEPGRDLSGGSDPEPTPSG
jgi:hypothetical protein